MIILFTIFAFNSSFFYYYYYYYLLAKYMQLFGFVCLFICIIRFFHITYTTKNNNYNNCRYVFYYLDRVSATTITTTTTTEAAVSMFNCILFGNYLKNALWLMYRFCRRFQLLFCYF